MAYRLAYGDARNCPWRAGTTLACPERRGVQDHHQCHDDIAALAAAPGGRLVHGDHPAQKRTPAVSRRGLLDWNRS